MKLTTLAATITTASLLTLACAQTEPAAPPPATPSTAPAEAPLDPALEKTLKLLEARGDTLKDFTATLRYTVEHARAGTRETNTGTAAYVKDAAGTVRVAILLDALLVNGAEAAKGLNHQIVFDGEWITEKDPQKKIYRRIQLTAPGAARQDPFRLRGPLPLPIGQKVDKVVAEFKVEPLKTDAKDPATAAGLKLTPRKEGAYDFTELDVVVDTADGVQLPTRLVKTGLDGNVTTIRLRDIKTNTGDAAKQPIFDVTEPTGTGWLKDIKPLEKK